MKKRNYIKPVLRKVDLDNVISLQMQTQPHNPTPRSDKRDDPSNAFESPFGDSPFG
jgi:hypothetical protein